jgi:hypothetical protein
MEKRMTLSAVVKPERPGEDLTPLAGRWRTDLLVKLVQPSHLTLGPVRVVTLDFHPDPASPPEPPPAREVDCL